MFFLSMAWGWVKLVTGVGGFVLIYKLCVPFQIPSVSYFWRIYPPCRPSMTWPIPLHSFQSWLRSDLNTGPRWSNFSHAMLVLAKSPHLHPGGQDGMMAGKGILWGKLWPPGSRNPKVPGRHISLCVFGWLLCTTAFPCNPCKEIPAYQNMPTQGLLYCFFQPVEKGS